MKKYKINLDKEYIFDIYNDRYTVLSENPTIVVYLKERNEKGLYEKPYCEFVNNPKNFLHDNPPVNEALANDVYLLLQNDHKELDSNLRIYYQGTVVRLNEFFKYNKVELPE